MSEFSDLVKKLVESGANPNDLIDEFETTVEDTDLWFLWGDSKYRKATVCSKCGSGYAGVCADGKVDVLDFDNPLFHKNQKGVTTIPLKEWLAKRQA